MLRSYYKVKVYACYYLIVFNIKYTFYFYSIHIYIAKFYNVGGSDLTSSSNGTSKA